MKSKSTAYLLWLPSLFGVCGLYYFYLGKPLKAIIWLLTLGIIGIGALIDLFTLGSAVENRNTRKELKTMRRDSV